MARTELTRHQHARVGDKYAIDLTDIEWALLAPFMPAPKTTGRPRTTSLRDLFDAILYMAIVEISMAIEKEFDIEIFDDDIESTKTLGDLELIIDTK